jgi:hypothetical protein
VAVVLVATSAALEALVEAALEALDLYQVQAQQAQLTQAVAVAAFMTMQAFVLELVVLA